VVIWYIFPRLGILYQKNLATLLSRYINTISSAASCFAGFDYEIMLQVQTMYVGVYACKQFCM
jgi:hypothetical protein